ncbi:MAG: hypothetical protein WCT03_16585 [Candidatus Obscuribacterales bacterium]|jgi:hypothetical protein
MTKSSLPVEVAIEHSASLGKTQVAIRRGVGTVVDVLFSCSFSLIPVLFYAVSKSAHPLEKATTINGDITAVIGWTLALTPIPLIYLRIAFHKIMHSPTPGESLSGLMTLGALTNEAGIKQEAKHALGQYLIFALSTTTAVGFVWWCVHIGKIGTLQLPGLLIAIAVILCFSFILISIAFLPRSNSQYQSLIDDIYKVVVKRLR